MKKVNNLSVHCTYLCIKIKFSPTPLNDNYFFNCWWFKKNCQKLVIAGNWRRISLPWKRVVRITDMTLAILDISH